MLLPGEIISEYNNKSYKKIIELIKIKAIDSLGGMKEQCFNDKYNYFILYLTKNTEEHIMKIKKFLKCSRFEIIFDGWAEEIYYIFEY